MRRVALLIMMLVVVAGGVAGFGFARAAAYAAVYTCPPQDEGGFPLGQSDTSTNPIFCSYPAFAGENPNDFYCTYSATTGVLVTDNDAGFCPPNAVAGAVAPLKVTTTSLAGGQVGSAYGPVTLAASGGMTPYSWSVTSGALPGGLSLDASTGVISGTPTAYGTFTFEVTVTDSENPAMTATSQTLSITVKPAPLMVTTTSLAAATGGKPYAATLAATGGVTPYSWSVTPGSLPPGLSLDSATGVISGTPDVAGTYDFTVTVTDSENPAMTANATLSITVSGPMITAIRPDSGPVTGFTALEITGTGLSCPARDAGCKVTVTFGGKPATVNPVRSDEILAVSPPGTKAGTVTVTVTVGGVSSQATTATTFTYQGFL